MKKLQKNRGKIPARTKGGSTTLEELTNPTEKLEKKKPAKTKTNPAK